MVALRTLVSTARQLEPVQDLEHKLKLADLEIL